MFQARKFALLVALTTIFGVLMAPVGSATDPGPASRSLAEAQASGDKTKGSEATAPSLVGAVPWLSLTPASAKVDRSYWNRFAATESARRANAQASPTAVIPYAELEPPAVIGGNDSIANAEVISGFGTGAGEDPALLISGVGASSVVATTPIGPFPEDDGSIPLANVTGLALGGEVTTSGTIGDGPWGSAGAGTGDFDFFAVTAVNAGEFIKVDVDTADPFGDLDSFIGIWDAAGTLLDLNDDDGSSYDSFIMFSAPAAGDYYVSIGGFGSFLPNDPFDPGSGDGAASEGDYDVTIAVTEFDRDVFALELDNGDVFGASLSEGTRLTLFDSAGNELMGSSQDASFIYGRRSPLPGGGAAVLNYVVPNDGTYYLAAMVDSQYEIDAQVFRPILETRAGAATQILFLDFDGATLDTRIFFTPPNQVTLSPLDRFLRRWGLTPRDKNAVIDAIIASVAESLSQDMRVLGTNGDRDSTAVPGDFDVEIRNSRDHADPWGQPNVSRVIIGGTINESGIPTIGIAQSIDPGNFATQESALVLLDLLSARPGRGLPTLNDIPLDPSATKIDLVGVAVGNIVAHEAGHFFGNWHTDQFNPDANIMDQGGNLLGTFGVGPDGIFGTADDVDVDFGHDIFVPNEGFTGTEDTLNTIAHGLATGKRLPRP